MNKLISHAAFCLLLLASCAQRQKADMLLYNARIYMVDSGFNVEEAMAVKDGKIVAVGSARRLVEGYDADTVIDAGGKTVFPGFFDAHAHFVGYGRTLFEVNLFGCNSWDEVMQRVQTFEKEHPSEGWIRGRGWDQNKWTDKAFPSNSRLSEMFPDRPVLLDRVDGHAAIANAKALELSGVTGKTVVNGGTVELNNGKPTGLLIDNAVDLVTKAIPKASPADYDKWLTAAQANCVAQGITTVADCGLMHYDIEQIDSLQRSGKLAMRVYVMLTDDTANYRRYLPGGPYKTDRLFVKGVKAYADGALGSRGACLLAPYSDKADWSGFLLSPAAHFDSLSAMLLNTGFQLCTHAIGDSGCRMVLSTYGRHLKGRNDKRWRIEHAQVVNPADFALFGRYSIIPSVQPTHATSDMPWAGDRLGTERLKGAYAYRELLQQNGWLPLGTDFPVEDISPFKTFYAAVVRKDAAGQPATGFQTENALTREQAIRGMTIWAAKSCFMENEVGSIEVGKKADFVILDADLMREQESKLLNVKVAATYIEGKCLYATQ